MLPPDPDALLSFDRREALRLNTPAPILVPPGSVLLPHLPGGFFTQAVTAVELVLHYGHYSPAILCTRDERDCRSRGALPLSASA